MCGPDVTVWFADQMNANAKIASSIGIGVLQWRKLVRAKGDWDFKTSETLRVRDACPSAGCERTVTLCDICLSYDTLGNIHYGFVGSLVGLFGGTDDWRLALWRSVLHEGAGAAQQGRSAWWAVQFGLLGIGNNRDAPEDRAAINLGFSLHDEFGWRVPSGLMCARVRAWEGRLRADNWAVARGGPWVPDRARTCKPCHVRYRGDNIPRGLR